MDGELLSFVVGLGLPLLTLVILPMFRWQRSKESEEAALRVAVHPHGANYSPSCLACQDDEAESRLYTTMPSTGRTSRPAPMSARNVRIRHHDLDCMCSTCHPLLVDPVSTKVGWGMRAFVWVCRQFWYWTPVAQLTYWMFVLAAVATYR